MGVEGNGWLWAADPPPGRAGSPDISSPPVESEVRLTLVASLQPAKLTRHIPVEGSPGAGIGRAPSGKGNEMNRKSRLAVVAALGALITGLMIPPAAADTAGTWSQYPTGSEVYRAQVQQPINTANTSNWSHRSKGGIPVMFKLEVGSGPAAFESIGSDTNPDNDFAFVSFTPSSPLLFSEITELSATYAFTSGNCHGGALRWSVRVSPTQSVFIYYGDLPNFTDCTTNNQSGVNLISLTDLRYDTSQVGGTFYDDYAGALALVGNMPIIRASLVLDAGWAGDQRLAAGTTATVNGNTYTWQSGGGAFTPTCDLPPATIEVDTSDPVVDGSLNEAAVQGSLADEGNAFRVVDCKYQYILSIPSLEGAGTYWVVIKIDDTVVPTPGSPGGKVKFDLK